MVKVAVATREAVSILDTALRLAYFQAVDAVKDVPYIIEILENLGPILEQEIIFDIKIRGLMQTYGVKTENELMVKIHLGLLNDLFPTHEEILEALHKSNLNFVNSETMRYYHMPVQEVW